MGINHGIGYFPIKSSVFDAVYGASHAAMIFVVVDEGFFVVFVVVDEVAVVVEVALSGPSDFIGGGFIVVVDVEKD